MTLLSGATLLDPINITDSKTVLLILADTVNRVRRVRSDGSIDIKTANCIGYLASKMIEAQKVIVTEERLQELKDASAEECGAISNSRATRLLQEVLAERHMT